jgi:hypothetical protein
VIVPIGTDMGEYRLVDPIPAVAWPIIAEAMADAPSIPCGEVTFNVEPMEFAAWASSDCRIAFSPDIWADTVDLWYSDSIVRHEIAHLLTMDETVDHGPVWRLAFAHLLAGVDYGPFSCALLVEMVWQTDTPLDSPNQLRQMLVPVTEPQPGDAVFISYQPGTTNTDAHHVAIYLGTDGDDVLVLEANGPAGQPVAPGRWPLAAVLGYGGVS